MDNEGILQDVGLLSPNSLKKNNKEPVVFDFRHHFKRNKIFFQLWKYFCSNIKFLLRGSVKRCLFIKYCFSMKIGRKNEKKKKKDFNNKQTINKTVLTSFNFTVQFYRKGGIIII